MAKRSSKAVTHAFNPVDFIEAVKEIALTKKIPEQEVLSLVKTVLTDSIRDYFRASGIKDEEGNYVLQPGDFKVLIDENTGDMRILFSRDIVATEDEVDDPTLQISLESDKNDILTRNPKAQVGDKDVMQLSVGDLPESIQIKMSKRLLQGIHEAEKNQLLNLLKEQIHTVIEGTIVKRLNDGDYAGYLIDIKGDIQALLLDTQNIPVATKVVGKDIERTYYDYKPGSRIKVYLEDVDVTKKNKLKISRTTPNYVKAILNKQIPDIANGDIEITNIVRVPGIKTKVMIKSRAFIQEPIATVTGYQSSRINTVTDELNDSAEGFNEKVEIIEDTPVLEYNVMQALKPASVIGVHVVKDELLTVYVIVDDYDDSKRKVYGAKKSNYILAKKILKIDNLQILSQAEAIAENIPFMLEEEMRYRYQQYKGQEKNRKYLEITNNEVEETPVTISEPTAVTEEIAAVVVKEPKKPTIKPIKIVEEEAPIKVNIETKGTSSTFADLESQMQKKSETERAKKPVKTWNKKDKQTQADETNQPKVYANVYSEDEIHHDKFDGDEDDYDSYDDTEYYDDDDTDY